MPDLRHNVRVRPLCYRDGEQSGVHTHDHHQLSYARSGVLTVTVEASKWVVPPLRAVWIPAGVPHNLQAHGATDIRPVHISAALGPRHLQAVAVVGVGPLLRALIDELARPECPSEEEQHHIEALLLLQLDRLAVSPLQLPTLTEPRLAAIQTALASNPGDRRTLHEWGKHCGASERTLTRLFANEVGTTFGQWRTQLRLHQALTYLAEGESVTTTAHRCGYQSTSAFIDTFRTTLGTTPGRFFSRETKVS